MNCMKCESDTKVIDSRPSKDGIRRRRVCKKCGHRFTTREYVIKDAEESDTDSNLSATINGNVLFIETTKQGCPCSTCREKIKKDVKYLQVVIDQTGYVHRLCKNCAPKLLMDFETVLKRMTNNFRKLRAFYD
jgi:hypothetical protein